MLLVVTSDDDGSLQGEYLMKRHKVGDFTAAGFLVVVKYCCKDSDNCPNRCKKQEKICIGYTFLAHFRGFCVPLRLGNEK